jgi:hypothetical protein
LHISTVSEPYVKVDAGAALFGVPFAGVDFLVDKTGLTFDLTMPLAKVTCGISSAGKLDATFAYGPDFKVPLPDPLGTIHFQFTIDFGLTVTVTSTDLTLSVTGGFSFMGRPLMFGPVSIDVNIAGLEAIVKECCDYIVNEAESLFGDVFKDALTWAKNVASGVVTDVDNIAAGLQSYFKKEIDDAASILHEVGVALDDAAADLKAVYGDATAVTLTAALFTPFGLTGALAGPLLKELGFSSQDIGDAVHSVLGLDAQGVANLLNDIGAPAGDIATVIQDIFTLSPDTISDVLKTAGFPVQVIADAFRALGGPFASVADALESALTTVEQALNPANW